jgi:hypothetical protein
VRLRNGRTWPSREGSGHRALQCHRSCAGRHHRGVQRVVGASPGRAAAPSCRGTSTCQRPDGSVGLGFLQPSVLGRNRRRRCELTAPGAGAQFHYGLRANREEPSRGHGRVGFPQQRSLGFTPASAVSSHVREHTRWDGLAETGWPPRPRSAKRRFKGTRDSRIAKRTVLRESPFMRSLSGVRMLHHHSSRRKARAVTALRRRPVDRGGPPSSEGTQ